MANSKGSISSAIALPPDSAKTYGGSIPETNRRGGPKTIAGKRRSSLNRLGSGLYSNAVVIRGEDKDDYLRFARAIVAGLDVQTAFEMAFAERLVSALWRSRRARQYEQAHLNSLADEAEVKREALQRAEEAFAEQQQAHKAILSLRYGERMSADEIGDAACALHDIYCGDPDAVYHEDVDDPEPPSRFWDLFPERNCSRKRVAAIATEVFRIFCGGRPNIPAEEFWNWALQKIAHQERQTSGLRDKAAEKYAEELRRTFLLDPTQGDAYDPERRAGRVLHDADRRLDRQVTQALADLETARRLRP